MPSFMDSTGLTLNEPSSPDGIVQTDLIPPQQPQTLKRLPLGGEYLRAANKTHNQSENTQFVQRGKGRCSMHSDRGTDTVLF